MEWLNCGIKQMNTLQFLKGTGWYNYTTASCTYTQKYFEHKNIIWEMLLYSCKKCEICWYIGNTQKY